MKNLYKYFESKEIKNFKNLMVLVIMALIFLSCAHRGLQLPESATSATNSSQVNIIRENRFFGFGLPLTVMFDNEVICSLRTGEYVIFEVEPGLHNLGLYDSIVAALFVPKGKYYFLIKTYPESRFGFEIEQIDNEIGNYLITISKVVE